MLMEVAWLGTLCYPQPEPMGQLGNKVRSLLPEMEQSQRSVMANEEHKVQDSLATILPWRGLTGEEGRQTCGLWANTLVSHIGGLGPRPGF